MEKKKKLPEFVKVEYTKNSVHYGRSKKMKYHIAKKMEARKLVVII